MTINIVDIAAMTIMRSRFQGVRVHEILEGKPEQKNEAHLGSD